MTRRTALGSLAVVAAGVLVANGDASTTYGYLDKQICLARGLDPRNARVFLDCVDVTTTHQVMALNDRLGFIEILKRRNGALHKDPLTGELERERLYGLVSVQFS